MMKRYMHTKLCPNSGRNQITLFWPFADADVSFLPLAGPNLNDVNEGDGFVIVSIVLGGATLGSALEVTVQTIPGGSATGNTVFGV